MNLHELAAAEEIAAEIENQHRSEVTAFGDSWAGAQIQVANAKAAVAAIRAAIKAHEA